MTYSTLINQFMEIVMISVKTGQAVVNFVLPALAEGAKAGIMVLAGTGLFVGGVAIYKSVGKVSTQAYAKAKNILFKSSSNRPTKVKKPVKTRVKKPKTEKA